MKMNLYSNLDEYDKEEDKTGMKLQKIKNNAAASLQITSEQLIKESQAHRTDEMKIPIQKIGDEDELNDYKLRKRKEFEEQIKRQRYHIGCWMKYTAWEENQGEFVRARSIFERALGIDYRNTAIWLKYAEMEMKNKFVNHARNVWERACKYLPRVDQFWYKWAYMEEMLGNYIGAREIFKSWMTWEPEDLAWLAFAKFEERMGEIQNAREVLYRYVEVHQNLRAYLRVAKFEEKHNNKDSCRRLYESALADLGNSAMNEDFFNAFIRFEMRNKEYDRCRVLFKFGLDNIPKDQSQKLYKLYVKFEKMFGTKESIDDVILTKRRILYEKEIEKNPMNYDVWFDYTRLEEQSAVNTNDFTRVREIYERAIMNVPPILEKKYWRRYIFLWINYSVFEESIAKNMDRSNEVYKKMIEIVPHKKFTFSKIWILYSHYHLRNKNLEAARKVFGMSIGICPREKVFKAYIELELQLGNVDRCRTIYEKFIETQPDNSAAWVKYAELEKSLDERDRCVAILETAVSQPLDMPEIVWKTYINFEISFENYEKVRDLYDRLLDKTKHVKVWLSYAKFEQEIEELENARKIYDMAYKYFKNKGLKEERLLILENWIKLEDLTGDEDMQKELNGRKPEKIKKRRRVKTEAEMMNVDIPINNLSNENQHDEDEEWEEFYDYIFPDDQDTKKTLKIISHAMEYYKNANVNKNDNE
jgi:crooked neck